MELVQFNKNGGPVTIDIAVQGSNVWSYVYASDFTFKNNSAADKDPNHTLGLPVNLDNDVNAWDIRFGNMSSLQSSLLLHLFLLHRTYILLILPSK